MPITRSRVNGEVLAAAVVLAVACGELVVLAVAPRVDRALATGVLLVAVAALVLTLGAVRVRRRRRSSGVTPGTTRPDRPEWFDASALADFPAALVEPYLRGPGAVELHRVQTGWILAREGHDARWLAAHLGLPHEAATALVDAARALPGTGQDPA
ncbi:hypothetical protein [Streptacidiphilus fuscans]|uniref:Uncharacterized protein n=1 Tax=Streptacidiphilus fuscans TaxID=2789292 RepID=A0A931BDR0_9ACTN|nr:hypothetical protein [Streptacidiphilus fuscans]MBF9068908.1 hypothetical protein [Streptacidiphilus fuscans]MBF9073362.1 hypothetical protein [Streptacidiphilus fuscans]